jgi:multiple sugar transport system substrate-binding protein
MTVKKAKRIVSVMTSLIVSCLALVSNMSCGHKPTITINVIGEAASAMDGLDKIKEKFTEEFGYKVVLNKYEFQTVQDKELLDFAGKQGNYDAIMGIYFNLGKYTENGFIVPFDAFLNDPSTRDPKVNLDQFFKPILQACCYYKGKLMGLPFSGQSMFVWFRKDIFENAQEQQMFMRRYGYTLPIPAADRTITWKQYKDLAEFFTRKSGSKLAGQVLSQDFYGTCLQSKRHPSAWYEFSNFIYSFGGQIISGDSPELDSPQVREALDYYRSLKQFAPPGVAQFTWDDALTEMQQGRVALEIMWADSAPYLEDQSTSTVVGKVGFGLVPIKDGVNRIVSQYGGWGFYVNAFSKHQHETAQFIQWVNRPDIQLLWAQNGGIPTTIATYDSPSYSAKPYAAAHKASLQHLTVWPATPYSSELIDLGSEAVSEAMSGDRPTAEILDSLQSSYRSVLAAHGVNGH